MGGKEWRLDSRQSGWVRRRGQVEGVGPGKWVESIGKGWGQTRGGVACVKGWCQQWKFQKGEEPHKRAGSGLGGGGWKWRGQENGEVSSWRVPPHPCLSSYPSPRDSAHSHPLPHGQSLPRVHRLRHQQHRPHPPTEDHSGLRFWHLLHPIG